MSDIRVTYSGLIALVVGLISVFTGIIFALIVTRRLSPEEFGIWSLIGGMISYFLIGEPVISFWSTRQIARGEKIGRTSLLSSVSFSLGALPLYLVSAYFISSVSSSHLNSMILASVLLPVTFLSQTLTGLNLGHKPHANSYGLMAFESLKIPAGLTLVYFLHLGVNGAILAILVAYLGKIIILIYFGRTRLKDKFNVTVLRNWLKQSWLPLYSNLGHVAAVVDVILYTVIIKSVIGVSYYSVSTTVTSMIAHAGLISQALYPKLLAKGSFEHVKENFTRLMYFAIPLLGICVIFSKPALFALNPVYANASIIVIILAVRTFFYVITSTFFQILLGIENIDIEKNPKYSSLAKSKLFLIPTLTNIQYIAYICILVGTLYVLNSHGIPELELVTWWSIISLATQVPFLIYGWILVQKNIKFSIPFTNILKYVAGTLAFVVIFYLTSSSIIKFKQSIYEFLPSLILELGICISVYLLLTYLIDKKTRILFKSIFSEFTTR